MLYICSSCISVSNFDKFWIVRGDLIIVYFCCYQLPIINLCHTQYLLTTIYIIKIMKYSSWVFYLYHWMKKTEFEKDINTQFLITWINSMIWQFFSYGTSSKNLPLLWISNTILMPLLYLNKTANYWETLMETIWIWVVGSCTHLNGVLGKFQKSFKEVSRVFHGSFNGISSKF